MRIALGLEYDGSAHCGWQSQPSGGAVQDALQSALAKVASRRLDVVAAGRTDAGVHALRQVVHFDTEAVRPTHAWVRGTNSFLPASVRVRWAREVACDFHARFSAIGRRYVYVLQDSPVAPAVLAGRIGWHHHPLDAGAMHAALQALVGEHDFTSFRAAECQAKSPIKCIEWARVERRGSLLIAHLKANAFLHHMVRNIVGALVYVGQGKQPVGWLHDLLVQRDRTRAAPTFMAAGLYLAGVSYPPDLGVSDEGIMPLALPNLSTQPPHRET